MKIAPRDAAKFVAKLPQAMRAVLVFGENAGLARDYADALTAQIVPNLKDVDRIVDLTAAEIRKDAAKLSDEASQLSMFSPGRRVIRVREASEGMGEVFANFLADSRGDALVIVEAAELTAKASLRMVFEQATNAAAIACYEDSIENLVQLAAEELKPLAINPEQGALELLVARLGADRRIVRNELQKIALYFEGLEGSARTLTKKIIDEFLGQSGDVEAGEIALAAALGDHKAVDKLLAQAEDAGGSPAYLVTAALRHLHALLAARAHGFGDDAVNVGRSRGLWGQSDAVIRSQLRLWSPERLVAAVKVLGSAEADTRTSVLPDWPLASRALLHVARLAG
jgi:DNA polymerase III subunit delta